MIKAPGEHHQGHILDTHEHKDDMSQNVRQIAKQRNASFVSAFLPLLMEDSARYHVVMMLRNSAETGDAMDGTRRAMT